MGAELSNQRTTAMGGTTGGVSTRAGVARGRPREAGGWRRGRPAEDPAKTKRWGFVTAKPSEFLVHCRHGRVLRSSGQGATCFKWPWDSVAVVPTSLQRVQFVADQITRERVGVEVSGLAVYRIAAPLLAFRVLNFSYPERAQEKLESTLTEMLVGATRRLVANLSIDECLEKRKAALADELLREIAPVVGGRGHLDDMTETGWGVVLDTVEIQEVRVLSESVFAAMQEPFRAALSRQSREARATADKESALVESASTREVELARLSATAAIDERRRELELEAERARVEDAKARLALQRSEAEAEIATHEVLAQAAALSGERERAAWTATIERENAEAASAFLRQSQQADVALASARAETERASAEARLVMAHKLPELASAVGARFGEVKVTQLGGGESPFGSIAQAVGSVVALVKEA